MKFNFFSIAYVGYCKTTKKKIIFIYYFSILFSLYLVVPVPGTRYYLYRTTLHLANRYVLVVSIKMIIEMIYIMKMRVFYNNENQ